MIFSKIDKKIDYNKLPSHIGIIMDGNGRWAKKRGLSRSMGHSAGAETFKKIVTVSGEIGISYLTVYAFSTENWGRPKEEVDNLMKLLSDYIRRSKEELADKNVKVNIIGERDMLSAKLLAEIEDLEKFTEKNTGLVLNIALSYGGRQEIIAAAKKCAQDCVSGKIMPEDITEEMISGYVYTQGQPDPDLIIRPSGEKRTSNFLLWQSAYSEYCFMDVLWPSFSKKHLLEAIYEYQNRDRRFGKV